MSHRLVCLYLRDPGRSNANNDESATLINEISGNATANVQIIADIRANLNDIRTAIQAATRTILSNTLGAIFGLVGATTGLTQIVVDQVTDIIQTVFSVLAQLEVGVRATQNLTPEIRTLLTNELNSLIATLAPFLTPLLVFFNAVRNLSASATVTVRGLLAAQQELGALIRRVLTSLGLGNLLALLTPPA